MPLKLVSLPTESEALQFVLMIRTPTAILNKTTKQAGRKVPERAAHFNPISQEWKIIMEAKNAQEIVSKKGKTRKVIGEATDKVPQVTQAQKNGS